MQRTDERDTKTRIADALSQFLTRYWKPIVFTLAAIVVVIVVVFVYLQIQSSRANDAARALEQLEEDYQGWLEAEEEGKDELEESVLSQVEDIVGRYSGMYAAGRALMLRAELHWENEAWADSASDYKRVADDYTETHLGPVALFNASAAEEAAGNAETAIEHINLLIERYSGEEPTPELARALFTRGRLNEAENNYDLAAESYNRLVDEHPQSSWTNLARNRIIALKTRGLIEE
jgi:tetratricopeptide (TPR) repeat protein